MTISESLIKRLNNQEVVSKNELQEIATVFYQENKNIFLRWATGISKTKASLDCVKDLDKILIVIDKNLREQNWIDEIEKWGYTKDKFTFTHYRSLKKYEGIKFDCIISDEGDSHSEESVRCIKLIDCNSHILLTADCTNEKYQILKSICKFKEWKITLSWAISKKILPEPKLTIIQVQVPNKIKEFEYTKFNKTSLYTGREYLDLLEKDMEYWKEKCQTEGWGTPKNPTRSAFKVFQLGTQRKKFFELLKLKEVLNVYNANLAKRQLLFVGGIDTTLQFPNPIHSKNEKGKNQEIIDKFNRLEIDVITCVDILVRGQNLNNCQICVIGSFTGNPTKVLQMVGRSLRLQNEQPEVYIPMIKGEKDEQNLNKFLKTYTGKIYYI